MRAGGARAGSATDKPQEEDGLGVPTDTLASTAKSKSLQGRNRELRFICEREKRVLDWEWHSVKVQFEKEKMLFKKRALRMLEAPRRRFKRPPGEEEEVDEESSDIPDGPPPRPTLTRRLTLPTTTPLNRPTEKPPLVANRGTPDEDVMLEELQELNARLAQEKKASRSAPPLTRGSSILTDPLFTLSSRLPKLEAEFSDLIKEHNALRRRKVEYKIKDFLVRIDTFKKGQKRPTDLSLLGKEGDLPKGGSTTAQTVTFMDTTAQSDDEVFKDSKQSSVRKVKVMPHSAKSPPYPTPRHTPRPISHASHHDDPHYRQDVTAVVRSRPRVDVEKSAMLAVWEDFTRDMSVDALKRLIAAATKNKFNLITTRGQHADLAPSFVSDFRSPVVFRQFLDSLSSAEGDQKQ